jgi:hypothetical protein
MAQGSKSRIVIWTIVGILVVLAVVMLTITKKSSNSAKPPINGQRYATQMENRFQKFERTVTAAQAQFQGEPAEQWQKINDDIARGRQVMNEMPALTEQKDLQVKRDSVSQAFSDARKVLTGITGKKYKGDTSGGQ